MSFDCVCSIHPVHLQCGARGFAVLVCKLLFDPSLDETAVMNDFLDGFYGVVGAETVRSYMQAVHAAASQTSTYLSITLGYRLKVSV